MQISFATEFWPIFSLYRDFLLDAAMVNYPMGCMHGPNYSRVTDSFGNNNDKRYVAIF